MVTFQRQWLRAPLSSVISMATFFMALWGPLACGTRNSAQISDEVAQKAVITARSTGYDGYIGIATHCNDGARCDALRVDELAADGNVSYWYGCMRTLGGQDANQNDRCVTYRTEARMLDAATLISVKKRILASRPESLKSTYRCDEDDVQCASDYVTLELTVGIDDKSYRFAWPSASEPSLPTPFQSLLSVLNELGFRF